MPKQALTFLAAFDFVAAFEYPDATRAYREMADKLANPTRWNVPELVVDAHGRLTAGDADIHDCDAAAAVIARLAVLVRSAEWTRRVLLETIEAKDARIQQLESELTAARVIRERPMVEGVL